MGQEDTKAEAAGRKAVAKASTKRFKGQDPKKDLLLQTDILRTIAEVGPDKRMDLPQIQDAYRKFHEMDDDERTNVLAGVSRKQKMSSAQVSVYDNIQAVKKKDVYAAWDQTQYSVAQAHEYEAGKSKKNFYDKLEPVYETLQDPPNKPTDHTYETPVRGAQSKESHYDSILAVKEGPKTLKQKAQKLGKQILSLPSKAIVKIFRKKTERIR